MINYTTDGTINAECIDGYANGSISTQLLNPGRVEPFFTKKWDDLNIFNVTIKEWTDNVNGIDRRTSTDDTRYIPMTFRQDEP